MAARGWIVGQGQYKKQGQEKLYTRTELYLNLYMAEYIWIPYQIVSVTFLQNYKLFEYIGKKLTCMLQVDKWYRH